MTLARSIVPSHIDALELPPFDPLNRRAAELRQAGHRVISLGQAVPYFGPPAAAVESVRAALDTPDIHRYVTDPGLPSLRTSLASRLGDTLAGRFAADDVVITAGGNHAFALAMTTVGQRGDEVVLPSPYFTNHQMMVNALGLTAVEAPVADRKTYAVRWSDIEPHVTPHTKAIVLCNPSNPTGAAVDGEDGRRIIEQAASLGIVVISDETYMHFVYEGAHWSAASAPDWRRNVIVTGTFSKSFGMMGWRLGFMLADASVCTQAIKVQDAMIICAPHMSQLLGLAATRDHWSYTASFHDELRARRQILAEGLGDIPGIEWIPQRAGLFAFARIAGCASSTALSTRLVEEAHVITLPGVIFGTSGEGCLRLSYGYATQDELREAVDRLRRCLR